MPYESIFADRRNVRIERIDKGWSADEKYRVRCEGRDYLLRVADADQLEAKRAEFDAVARLWELKEEPPLPVLTGTPALPVPRAEKFGQLPGKVYCVYSWMPGEEGLDCISRFSQRDQYALGVSAGSTLARMHRIGAPEGTAEWEARFGAKIDRAFASYAACRYKHDNGGAFMQFATENRLLLRGRPTCFQHGDYHLGNMVISAEGQLGIIDFNRVDYEDPWYEFNRIAWSAAASPAFASGQIYGYFNGNIPEMFWRMLALYLATSVLGSLPWAVPFGQEEIEIMQRQGRDLYDWYDGFARTVPSWFFMPRYGHDRSALKCSIHPLGSFADYTFSVVLSRYDGKWMLSRHRKRDTWETQGGHIEPGETPMESARRELYEESGVVDASLHPAFDYLGWNDFGSSAGVVFFAEIHKLADLPQSEMAEVRLFDALPDNLTYPNVTPKLFDHLVKEGVHGML